jgi:hypothetical protein
MDSHSLITREAAHTQEESSNNMEELRIEPKDKDPPSVLDEIMSKAQEVSIRKMREAASEYLDLIHRAAKNLLKSE